MVGPGGEELVVGDGRADPGAPLERTAWPAEVSSRTPAGVMATRYSSSFTSLGTPTIIGALHHSLDLV